MDYNRKKFKSTDENKNSRIYTTTESYINSKRREETNNNI